MRRWSLLLLMLLACDDGGGEAPGPIDAGQADDGVLEPDAAPDAALPDEPDGALPEPDMALPEPDMGPFVPPPVADEVEPEELAPAWRVGLWRGDGNDSTAYIAERGRFAWPEQGTDFAGVEWADLPETGENGALGSPPAGRILYAAAKVELAAGERLFARTTRSLGVFGLGGWLLAGNVYNSRRHRVPVATEAGENLVLVRAFTDRETPEAVLWKTTDEVHLNFADVTAPDLRVGESEALPIGVAFLNLTGGPLGDLRAKVVESEHFEATELRYPSVGPWTSTQLGFLLQPKAPFADYPDPAEGEPEGELVPVRLRVESPDLEWTYERTLELRTIRADRPHRRTYVSPVDRSVQYYGVNPPTDPDPERDYAMVLSLHGAGVEGIGQARSYASKDWAYIIAPTNRRPFGFDWEVWGQLQGLNSLDDAMRAFRVDPTRVYVTGHSMGGHGTWQFGALHPGRFAVVGPSAGWMSFYSYQGSGRPQSVFARAAATSDTHDYLENLARRAVYVIHGSADDNVPVREGRDNYAAVSEITEDAHYHEQPDAGHWWNVDPAPGADCVDWPPLFELMRERRLDPTELEFDYRSAPVNVEPRHSYVTLRSAQSPLEDMYLHSMPDGDGAVVLQTRNVRSMVLDGAALAAKGVARVVVDDVAHEVTGGPMLVGPETGKRLGAAGPFNEVFYRPHCYVYPDELPQFASVAAYYTAHWNIIGNGHACALPASRLTDEIREGYNLIHLGGAPELVADRGWPLGWDDIEIRIGETGIPRAALLAVFPEAGHLSAVLTAAAGEEPLLYRVVPFSSRGSLPDFLIWSQRGGQAAGFFDAEWGWDRSLVVP